MLSLSTLYSKTNKFLMLLGDDFSYSDIKESQLLLNLVEDIMKKTKKFSVKIATASEYFDAVFSEHKKFKVFEGDFLPYVTNYYEAKRGWTGFYSTNLYLKKKIYDTHKIVRVAEVLDSLVNNQSFFAYGVSACTHHDSITGTCQNSAYNDYIIRLQSDYENSIESISKAFKSLLKPSEKPSQVMVPYKILIIFNPLNWKVSKLLSFESDTKYLQIVDGEGNNVLSQSVPIDKNYEIYYNTTVLPFAFKVLFVTEYSNPCLYCSMPSTLSSITVVNSGKMILKFDKGFLTTIIEKNILYEVNTSLVKYEGFRGGPYIFCPTVTFI